MKREEIILLRKSGLSYSDIGRRLGISRERVRQVIRGEGTRKLELGDRLMLSTGEVCQLLGVHVNTVRRWSNQGILKMYRIGTRKDRRFKRRDIEEFLEQGPGMTNL